MKLKSQRGDTLIEVVIAMVIISSVLVGASQIASTAARQGVDARERSQVAEFLQEQAEALRNYRDNHSWNGAADLTSFTQTAINLGTSAAGFWMTQVGISGGGVQWAVTPGSGMPKFPDNTSVPTLVVKITCIMHIRGVPQPDEYDFTILATWASASGGNNTSEVHSILSQTDNLRPG